jgi:hypothetical protein
MSVTSRFHSEWLFWLSLKLAVAFLLAGTVTFVVSRALFDPVVFGERAERSLSDPRVAAFAAELVTDSAIQQRPDLIAFRPLLLATANTLVQARPFRAVVGTAAQRAHQAAFSEGAERILLSLPDLGILVQQALEQASPDLAAKIPKQLEKAVTTLGDSKRSQVLIDVWKLGGRLRWAWRVLLPFGGLLMIVAIWMAPARRRGLVRIGGALIACGLILGALLPFGYVAALAIPNDMERELVRGLSQSYLGDLGNWALFYAGLGVLISAGAASLLETVDPLGPARTTWRVISTRPATHLGQFLWAISLLFAGMIAILYPMLLWQGLVVMAGVWAAFAGIRELFSLFLYRIAPKEMESITNPLWNWVPAAVVGGIVILAAAAWAFWRLPAATAASTAHTIAACNGDPQLCDKRLDEVVFAGAHNAMSNQSRPDWMFPHHQAGIPQMLNDGIRALLIDVHSGFPGAARIKTNMDLEPNAAKMKQAVGDEGYQAALRIRNRLVGADEGRPGIYLCHGFCELGAYELEPTLRDIKTFLVLHPDEVVIIVFEDYVPPVELGATLERAGLGPYIYRGGVSPWPTLRDMISSGQRLVTFIESGRPGVPWLRPAFENIRETPYSFHKVDEFSCRANRGGDGGTLFQINHWIETTPMPKPSNAAVVNAYDFLLSRARQCQAERHHLPNIIAVDFYRTGDLLKVVETLNHQVASPPVLPAIEEKPQ